MFVRIKSIVKRLKVQDLLAPWIFLLMIVPSWIFRLMNRLKHRTLWLVSEDGEARDNGYHFYKYVREKHPDDYCFYAIRKDSAGFNKIAKLGNTIKFGSLKHWLYYMSAKLNISSHPGGSPSAFFWFFVHETLGLYRNRVFLQHGITKDDMPPLYYARAKYKYFICGAKREFAEIEKHYGYPDGAVLLTGFPRWDNLVNARTEESTILIMPTWRKYLEVQNSTAFENKDFEATPFFKAWNGLLNNADFVEYIEKHNVKVYFYPHQNVQEKLHLFSSPSKNVKFVSMNEEISKYLSSSALLITDYSSVAFDFAYLGKPVVYYQFDQQEFFAKHHKRGYYEYGRDGFGPICQTAGEVVKAIKAKPDKKYLKRAQEFFDLRDNHNSERVYEAIK